MVVALNENRPNPPAIARILGFMGWVSIIGCACGVMLAFSGYPWVNGLYALLESGVAIILGILFIGQAKTLEALTILNARMKSRFALEGISGSAALGEATAPMNKPGTPPIIPQTKDRVVKISADEAKRIGVPPR